MEKQVRHDEFITKKGKGRSYERPKEEDMKNSQFVRPPLLAKTGLTFWILL